MEKDNITRQMHEATKWTIATEFLSKVITPVTGIILARILTPEAFGVIASILVVTSFAEMFADAGFQKYFIQHNFVDVLEKKVAFMTALITCCLSAIFIWGGICFFSRELSSLLGSTDISEGVCVAGSGILLNSFSGMQSAVFKREFNFKLLFKLRIVALCVPIFITIPLAVIGMNYWALIIGLLSQQLMTCIFQWKYMTMPFLLTFDIIILKKMLSFSLWTLFESITIWFSTWGQFFLVGTFLNSYYLGLFRGGLSLTNSIFSLISGAIMPVLFSALSRLQNDMDEFREVCYTIQRKCVLFVAPLGVGIFVFNDIVIDLLLGQQWHEADLLVGLWGIVGIFSISVNYIASEALRAKGLPKISSFSQLLFFPLVFFVIYKTYSYGFSILVIGTCLCSLELYLVKIVLLKHYLDFSIKYIFHNIIPIFFAACLSGYIAFFIRNIMSGYLGIIIAVLFFIVCYIACISIDKQNRMLCLELVKFVVKKI